MDAAQIRTEIERNRGTIADPDRARAAATALLRGLEDGHLRAASRADDGRWQVHAWIKQGILLCFRLGRTVMPEQPAPHRHRDLDLLPPRDVGTMPSDVRVVPGGATVRSGAHIGAGCVLMPPSYVNIGAHVGRGAMVDSHALVGSCAQIGERVHLSAGAQIGGVLEPAGQLPVVVEDEAMIGGNCGLYEGVLVRRRAVIGAGVVLTGSMVLHDLVHETVHTPNGGVLEVPDGAVVVMGSRPAQGAFAAARGLCVATPLIVKYRDARTDARTALEDALRPA